jgi:hypothetical protein
VSLHQSLTFADPPRLLQNHRHTCSVATLITMVLPESLATAPVLESSCNVQLNRSSPSFHLYLVTFYSALSGFLFGYDTGIVSGALLLLRHHFNLSGVWQEGVVSITILGAWIFSVCASFATEKFGRKPCILICSLWFAVGSAVMAAAEQVWVLVVGRFIVGAAVGLSSAVVPMYIAEVATPSMRGKLVTFNNCLITGKCFANQSSKATFVTTSEPVSRRSISCVHHGRTLLSSAQRLEVSYSHALCKFVGVRTQTQKPILTPQQIHVGHCGDSVTDTKRRFFVLPRISSMAGSSRSEGQSVPGAGQTAIRRQ